MDTCSICLDEVLLDDSITLSCEHLFHKDCIEECIDHKMKSIEYGTNKLCCPNCRINITELDDTNLEKKLKELHQKPEPIMPCFDISVGTLMDNLIGNPPYQYRNNSMGLIQTRIFNEINNMTSFDIYMNRGAYIIQPPPRYTVILARPPLSRSIYGTHLIERRNTRLVTRLRLTKKYEKIKMHMSILEYINKIEHRNQSINQSRKEQKHLNNKHTNKPFKNKRQKNFKMLR